jgi:hypothetical protein
MRQNAAYGISMLALMCSLSLIGCASQIVPIGADTYMVSDSAGFASQSTVRAKLMGRGAAHCAKQGKRFLLDSHSSSDCNGCLTEASITFLCLNPSDPGYGRPKLRPRPDVVIQDNRR